MELRALGTLEVTDGLRDIALGWDLLGLAFNRPPTQ